jgi:hypothetical protein
MYKYTYLYNSLLIWLNILSLEVFGSGAKLGKG